jgi:D-sedoheptulose 7-phosphate isomerase
MTGNMAITFEIANAVGQRLLARNEISERFLACEALRLAEACGEMSERFLKGGRLLAFGQGAHATDAQHVSVEFVHPVIVGKRALPALDLSLDFRPWLETLLRSDDIVMGFGPPEGDKEVLRALQWAHEQKAMTFALPGPEGSYAVSPGIQDPFVHQEIIEILYHTLWETVHVFFEHRELGHDIGSTEFLYPFLGKQKQETKQLIAAVADSIRTKVHDDSALRCQVAQDESEQVGNAIVAIAERIGKGGKLIFFGNGGSATDANDWALDCVSPPAGLHPIPAISLAMEPANISAIANDIGSDVIFLRQLVAHARPEDVAVAISTSGGSKNLILALEEARRRGMLTIAILGYDGGEIKRRALADFPIVVRSDYIPRIQEVHASIGHVILEMVEEHRRGQV